MVVGITGDTEEASVVLSVGPERRKIAQKMGLPLRYHLSVSDFKTDYALFCLLSV